MIDQPDTAAIRAQMGALKGFVPGPWRACAHISNDDENGCSCGYRGVIWGSDGGRAICQPGHEPARDGEEGTEPPRYDRRTEVLNARLIAAAPDMHATILALCDALDDARQCVSHANLHADCAIADMETLRADNERLRAALTPFVLYVHDDYRRGEGRYVLASVAVIGGKGDGWLEAEDFRRARSALAQKEDEA